MGAPLITSKMTKLLAMYQTLSSKKKGYTSSVSAKSSIFDKIWHFHALKSQAVEFQGGARKAPRTEMPRIATRTKLQEEVTSNLTHLSTSSSTSIIFTSNMGTNLLQTKFVNMI